jgi:hypothetical protein
MSQDARPASIVRQHCSVILRWNDQDYFGNLFFDDSSSVSSTISEIGSLNTL